MSRDLRPVYTVPSEAAARERFADFDAKWGKPYPAISKLWGECVERVHPVPGLDVEIRRVICSTDAIESINARYRRAVKARGHFPNDTAALKCLYLVTRGPSTPRDAAGTLGNDMEARTERVRDSVRRKNQLTDQATSSVNRTLPSTLVFCFECGVVWCVGVGCVG
jgi:transposase-like protein